MHIGNGEFWLGDCLELMKNIPDHTVDMILCDLPYGTTACSWDAIIPFEPLWEQYWRIAKPNAAVVLFGAEPFSSLLRISDFSSFKYDWVWVKNTQTGISLSKYQPMRKHEMIHIFYKNKTIFNKQMVETKSEIMKNHKNKGYGRGTKKTISEHTGKMSLVRGDFESLINPNTVLEFDIVPNRLKSKFHPTQKPVALFEYMIKTYTNEDMLVLDNCAGSGTTAIAAENTSRKWICIEKDETYYNKAIERIQNEIIRNR